MGQALDVSGKGQESSAPETLRGSLMELNILWLGLVHAEVVSQLMKQCLSDFMTDFGFAGTDRLDILLVQNDTVWSRAEIEHAFLSPGHPLKDSQKQAARLVVGSSFSGRRPHFLAQPWPIFNQYREVVDLFAELPRKRVQDLLHQPNEVFP